MVKSKKKAKLKQLVVDIEEFNLLHEKFVEQTNDPDWTRYIELCIKHPNYHKQIISCK